MGRLSNTISNTNILDKKLIDDWASVQYVLREKHIISTETVDAATAARFVGDLEGLFMRYIGISMEYMLPHILVNGYRASTEYDGNRLKFFIIDNNILAMYRRLFLKKIK